MYEANSADRASFEICVLVYEPGRAGRVEKVLNSAGMFQVLVGGFFVFFHDTAAGAFVYCCENGISLGLERNHRFDKHVVAGTAFFAKRDALGNASSLDDDDVRRIRALYG